MNILHLATVDNGGGAYFCAEALNRHSEHQARAIRTYQGPIGYPYDVLKPRPLELADLYLWADVLHLHDEAGALVLDSGWKPKSAVITWHGTKYRQNHKVLDARCRKRGWLVTVSTLDLTKWGAAWLPMPRDNAIEGQDLPAWPHGNASQFRVLHAPTDRTRKKSDLIEQALFGLVWLQVIENMPWSQCMVMKRVGAALLDGWHGYGNNSIEAWSLGLPVVSGGPAWLLAMMQEAWGTIPFAVMKPTKCGILCPVARLVQEPEFYADVQRRGREHYLRYHTPQAVAARLCKLYERAREAA